MLHVPGIYDAVDTTKVDPIFSTKSLLVVIFMNWVNTVSISRTPTTTRGLIDLIKYTVSLYTNGLQFFSLPLNDGHSGGRIRIERPKMTRPS